MIDWNWRNRLFASIGENGLPQVLPYTIATDQQLQIEDIPGLDDRIRALVHTTVRKALCAVLYSDVPTDEMTVEAFDEMIRRVLEDGV